MKRSFRPSACLGLSLVVLTLLAATPARANEQVYENLLPGTVLVGAEQPNGKPVLGSGVLVDAKRKWIVTAGHVVRDSKEAVVAFPVLEKGKLITAKRHYFGNFKEIFVKGRVLAHDKTRDLAVVALDSLPATAKAVSLAAESARPGQTVHLIGNPMIAKDLWLYSWGKVRQVVAMNDTFAMGDDYKVTIDCQVVLSTIPVNSGDSGGPVVNDKGELVGLTHGFLYNSTAMSTLIDVSEIRAVLTQAEQAVAKQ
jgi:S1-C subfamily serine protease